MFGDMGWVGGGVDGLVGVEDVSLLDGVGEGSSSSDETHPRSSLLFRWLGLPRGGYDMVSGRGRDLFICVCERRPGARVDLFGLAAPPRRRPLLIVVVGHRRAAAVGAGDDEAKIDA